MLHEGPRLLEPPWLGKTRVTGYEVGLGGNVQCRVPDDTVPSNGNFFSFPPTLFRGCDYHWERADHHLIGKMLAYLVGSRQEWMTICNGLTIYACEAGPWCQAERKLVGGPTDFYLFLSWVPGWSMSGLFHMALWRSYHQDELLAQAVKDVLQFDLAELKSELVLTLLRGGSFPDGCRTGQ